MEYMFDAKNAIDSKPQRRDPKAYERFKAMNTDYGSRKKCSYGDRKKPCNPGCRFWDSCIKGKHENERKGDGDIARSDTESADNIQK